MSGEGEREPTDDEGVESENSERESEDQPAIDDDELADFSEVAEEIAESETDSETTDQESADGDDSGDQESDRESEQEAGENLGQTEMEVSLGTVYTNGLGMMAAVSRQKYGSLDEDERDDLADDYAEMARQIELDAYLDEWVEQAGGLEGLSPGQAVVLGTLMWGGMVMMDDPAMAGTLVEEVRPA